MLKLMRLAVCLAAVVVLCGPGECAFTVGEPDEKGEREFFWQSASLDEVLEGLYTSCGTQTLAALLDTPDTAKAEKATYKSAKVLPDDMLNHVAFSWNRDTGYMGMMQIILPYKLDALRKARESIAAFLAASLTPEQLAINRSSGGVPFSMLTLQQQTYARYLVTAAKDPKFPEPELSVRLSKAKVTIAAHPSITWSHSYTDVDGKQWGRTSGFCCDWDTQFERGDRWLPGHIGACKLYLRAGMEPGPDAPGDSTSVELAGVYRLPDLIKHIKNQSHVSIAYDSTAKDMRIAAYCTLTSAGLARAIATVSGMEWRLENGVWALTSGALVEVLSQYGSARVDDYTATIKKTTPELERVARSGCPVVVADKEWQEPGLTSDMVEHKPVDWASLAPEQQDYLRTAAERIMRTGQKTGNYSLVDNLPVLKMDWSTYLELYIATDDSLLCSEGLVYK